jgi:hypothetical protein
VWVEVSTYNDSVETVEDGRYISGAISLADARRALGMMPCEPLWYVVGSVWIRSVL